jgi:ribonucleotide reductase alpha subunit
MIWVRRAGVGEGVEVAEVVAVVVIMVDKTVDMLPLQARREEDRTRMEHRKMEEE